MIARAETKTARPIAITSQITAMKTTTM